MKALLTVLISVMGFLLGLAIAGVGGLWAENLTFLENRSANTKKLNTYWAETGLSFGEVSAVISNAKCNGSELYFRACLNGLIEGALSAKLKLAESGDKLVVLEINDLIEEKNEKDKLISYISKNLRPDFENLLKQLETAVERDTASAVAADTLNAFMSVYFDPHTYILPADYYAEVGSKLKRSKYFVGLFYEKTHGEYYIKKVAKTSDAEIAGLKLNDKIISINDVKVKNLPYANVSALLKNEKAESLKFNIERGGKPMEIMLVRSYREISNVLFDTIKSDEEYALITLSKFNEGVCKEVSKYLKKLKNKKSAGLILDLRDNPGGQLNEAACMAGLFLGEDKKAYYVEYFDDLKPNEVVLTSEKKLYDGPMTVLVNAYSASSSELLAGALQSHKRAVIIGERTFGKGTFQEPEVWSLNKNIHIYKTQGLYLLPNQNSTQLIGIKPDINLIENKIVKREGDVYFNPLKTLRTSQTVVEESKAISAQRCILSSHKKSANEDVMLAESVTYLNCVKDTADTLAQSNTGKAAAD